MNRIGPPMLVLLSVMVLSGGCGNKQLSDNDQIRQGINEHLASLKTINLSAMDINVTSVSIQDNKAQAQVNFHPKTGAPAGADMQVAYSLEKQNGKWSVVTTQPTGGMIQHPPPGQTPPQGFGGTTPGGTPSFDNLLHGQQPGGALPPGHPVVNSPGKTTSPST
jgi:hypothetical protein